MKAPAGQQSATSTGMATPAGRRTTLAALAASAAIFAFTPGHAESFKAGDVDVSVDTTISFGAMMRTSDRDCSHVSLLNGGCRSSAGRATSVNSDNGNLNFDRWDFTSAIGKATVDIQAKWQNYGVFVRPRAFYDLVYANNNMEFRPLERDARKRLDYKVEVLDAFAYGNFDIGGHQASLRVGKQALNWGESLFIPGGINAFQAFDVNALRSPGSELKEAMVPMPMIYASFAATDNLSIEAFWQFGYAETELDPAGSFFSTDDIVGGGSLPALLRPGVDNPDLALSDGDLLGLLLGASPVPIALGRTKDRGQSDTNQFGAAMHYYAEEVGTGTDFGLYFTRYSSRLPYLGFANGPLDTASACAALGPFAGPNCGAPASAIEFFPGGIPNPGYDPTTEAAFAYAANMATYFYEFPTINTIGGSFSTTIGGTAFAGEVTYSPDMPFGISDNELNASQLDGTGASLALLGQPRISLLNGIGVNQSTLTHIDLDAWQGQFNTITAFTASDPYPALFSADGGMFIVNAGFVYVPDAGDYPLNRSGPEGGLINPYGATLLADGATNPQYATAFSGGYRLVTKLDYNNPFNVPVVLSPYVAWRHDVSGFSPGPVTANYLRGLKEVSLGVDVDYASKLKGNLSWTSSFGGGWYNDMSDRDFLSASISYSF